MARTWFYAQSYAPPLCRAGFATSVLIVRRPRNKSVLVTIPTSFPLSSVCLTLPVPGPSRLGYL